MSERYEKDSKEFSREIAKTISPAQLSEELLRLFDMTYRTGYHDGVQAVSDEITGNFGDPPVT
jgi:hypothetical protein